MGRKILKPSEKKVMVYFFIKKKYENEAKKRVLAIQKEFNDRS